MFATQDKPTASQQSREVQQETKTSTPQGTTTIRAFKVSGKIESFDPGKSIKVSVPGKTVSTKSWSLDNKNWTYNVPKNLKAGDWVRVNEKTDSKGHKTVTIQHSSNRGTASRMKASSYR